MLHVELVGLLMKLNRLQNFTPIHWLFVQSVRESSSSTLKMINDFQSWQKEVSERLATLPHHFLKKLARSLCSSLLSDSKLLSLRWISALREFPVRH